MMFRVLVSAATAALGLVAGSLVVAADMPGPPITAAVADAGRPSADRDRDADRKPAEVMAFAGISPGYKIAEVWPGGGYFTRLFSKAVGEKGVVYALVPPPRPDAPPRSGPPTGVDAMALDPQYANLKVEKFDPAARLPEPVDLVWTSLNYHDMHARPDADMMAINKMVFNALKPGGTYIVIDHAAATGSGARDASTLHRIDPELVKQEVLAAGFEFVRESPLLHHEADDHSKRVHEAPLRGRTDQFVYMFRKP